MSEGCSQEVDFSSGVMVEEGGTVWRVWIVGVVGVKETRRRLRRWVVVGGRRRGTMEDDVVVRVGGKCGSGSH